MPSSSGTVPRGAAQPLRALGGERERAGSRLGIGKRDDRRAGLAEHAGRALGADDDGDHRLVGSAELDGARIAAATSSAPATTGRHEEHDQRVDVRVGEDARNDGLVGRRGRRAEQVDRVREARLARHDGRRAPRRVCSVELRQLEPGGLAGVGAEDAEPAGVREHADAAARGAAAGVESSAAASTSSSSVRARSTPAWWKSASTRGLGAGERGGVRARRARAGGGRPGLEGEDRLAARDPPRDARELARVAERLEVEQHEVGRRRRPPTTRAGRSRRRRPCCRSRRTRRTRARAPPPSRAARARARRSATRSRSARPAARAARRWRSGRGRGRRCRGSSGRRAARRARGRARAAAPAARAPPAPVSAKPAEITQSARTPWRSASAAASSTCSAGQADRPRARPCRGSPRSSGRRARRRRARPCRLTGYAAPAKSASRMLRKSSPPIEPRRREAPITATDAGCEERPQRGDDGGVVALLDPRVERAGRGDREAKLDLAAVALAHELEAGVGEHRRARPRFDASTSATKREIAVLRAPGPRAARAAGCRSRAPARRRATAKAISAASLVADPRVARDRDDALVAVAVCEPAGERAAVDQSGSSSGSTSARSTCRNPWKRRNRLSSESPAKNASRRRASAATGGRSRSVPPSRRMTSTASATAWSRLDANERHFAAATTSCPTGTALSTTLSACVSAAAPKTS